MHASVDGVDGIDEGHSQMIPKGQKLCMNFYLHNFLNDMLCNGTENDISNVII